MLLDCSLKKNGSGLEEGHVEGLRKRGIDRTINIDTQVFLNALNIQLELGDIETEKTQEILRDYRAQAKTFLYSKEILERVIENGKDQKNYIFAITDFCINEAEHVADKKNLDGRVKEFMDDVRDNESARMLKLRTPFYNFAERKACIDRFPLEVRQVADEEFNNGSESKYADIAQYSVALGVYESGLIPTIVSSDNGLRRFIKKSNKILGKNIETHTPMGYIKSVV